VERSSVWHQDIDELRWRRRKKRAWQDQDNDRRRVPETLPHAKHARLRASYFKGVVLDAGEHARLYGTRFLRM